MARLTLYHAQRLVPRLGGRAGLARDLYAGEQRRQGVPQFVGEHGKELVLAAVGLRQSVSPRPHGVLGGVPFSCPTLQSPKPFRLLEQLDETGDFGS